MLSVHTQAFLQTLVFMMEVANIIVLFSLLMGLVSANNDQLLSVTNFPEIEKFYLKARKHDLNQHFAFEKPMWKTLAAQNSQSGTGDFCICSSILSSTHFKHRGIYPLNWEDPNVAIELRIFHPAIFDKFYPLQSEKREEKKPKKQSRQGSAGSTEERSEEEKKRVDNERETPRKMEIGTAVDENQLVYTLPYTEHPVNVTGQFVSEGLVSCLARTAKPFGVKMYFVSLAYHHHRDEADEYPMYFVFRNSGPLYVLEALAEEVAVANKRLTSVETNYLKKRWLYGAKPTKRHWDPICSLSASIKLRICASIVASEKYRRELEFVPALENVFETCHMRDVFLYELSRRGGNLYGSEGLSEWMYACKTRKVDRAARAVHLFVSRSYDDRNSVFVYKVVNGRYEMVDSFENIYALYRK